MLFPLFSSVFLLPMAGPAAALVVLLGFGAGRRRAVPGLLLALGLLVPTFVLAQCLLSAAGWCVNPIAPAAPGPLYVPWPAELLLAPVCYLYFRVLANPALRRPGAWRHLLPGLGQVGLFAGVAVLGLGYRHGAVAVQFGQPGTAFELLHYLVTPLALVCYVSLLLYGFKTLDDYRRYRQHLAANYSDAERPRFLNQRPLLLVLIAGFGLGLSFVALDAWFGPFRYPEIWYGFAVRGGLVFGLAVVGLQASYAATGRLPRLGMRLVAAPGWPLEPAAGPARASVPAPAATEFPSPGPAPAEEALAVKVAGPAPLPVALEPLRVQLLACMEAEQPCRAPELTLTELAQRLGTNPGFLSKVINAGCGQNFNDFVNSYRVAEAQRRLADPRFAHFSLVGVALDSGFNSKSTFNRVFKKLAGYPPSEVARPKS